MKDKNILLSADGDVSRYRVSKHIWNHFDELIEDFHSWNKKNRYDETLFVEFLKARFGESSIVFVNIVGQYAGSPNMIFLDGKDITEQYADTKRLNF